MNRSSNLKMLSHVRENNLTRKEEMNSRIKEDLKRGHAALMEAINPRIYGSQNPQDYNGFWGDAEVLTDDISDYPPCDTPFARRLREEQQWN